MKFHLKVKEMSTNLYVHLTKCVLDYLEINIEREDDEVTKEVTKGIGMFMAHMRHDYNNENFKLWLEEAIRHYEELVIQENKSKPNLKVIK